MTWGGSQPAGEYGFDLNYKVPPVTIPIRFGGAPVQNSAGERCCVRRVPLYLALHAACLGVILSPPLVCAQGAQSSAEVSELPLPGGIRAALAVLNDPVPADRSQFLVEIIRRTYATPIVARSDPREVRLRTLLAHLERERRANVAPSLDTVPLPLTSAIWIDVLGGRPTADAIVEAILESRNASLLYYGLMSLDGPTRAWIASQRNLLTELAARHAPAFAVAAPGFRVADGVVRVPGGERAALAWESLVGRPVSDPVRFLEALLGANDGRGAYLLTAMSELTREQIAFAAGGDPARMAAALRRLSAVTERAAPGWNVAERTFSRPRRDPVLLLADLATDDRGVPVVPGSRAFWEAVFSASSGAAQRAGPAREDPAEFPWLCEQVFSGSSAEQRSRYESVLFASRVIGRAMPPDASAALDAVRSALAHPALAAVLERARVTDVAAYAAASRRAARLSAISDGARRARALAQFQGTLALLARMVSRGGITPAAFTQAVTSLSAIEWDQQARYDGALVRWFAAWVRSANSNADLDEALLALLAGPAPAPARFVDWEGTRYRLDVAAAERRRLARLLGDDPHPSLARAAAQSGGAADEAWAESAVEFAYAAALGQPEQAAVSLEDLARLHDFGFRSDTSRSVGPWTLPVGETGPRGYRVGGSLLGLELVFAESSLTRVSTKAPPRKPSISSEERAAFAATVALVEPPLLSDDDRSLIANAMRTARARLAAARTPADAQQLAASIPLSAIRRTVFPWILAHDPSRTASFFSPQELLGIGLGTAAPPDSLHAWGASAYARLGCLCLRVLSTRAPDLLAGRVNAGILASGMPDLGLRLAEILDDLHMPAALLGSVLASATLDFVNGASSRDEDDRRGPVEFVLALRPDRVEEYLALLTTGGPLVPPRDDSDRLAGVAPAGRRP